MARGYMVEIDRLRDPQDGTPLALPLDNVPGHIRANSRVRVWDDKMKTLIYCFETGIVGGMAKAQHIFTCNLPDLQRLPSELFNSIQVHVPLRRPTGDTHTSKIQLCFRTSLVAEPHLHRPLLCAFRGWCWWRC